MHPPTWRDALIGYITREAKPAEKYGHQPRLYALTLQIGAGLTYDDDTVFAAAYLHDLGVFLGHRPEDPALLAQWDHVAYTLAKAPAILAEHGCPAEKIPAVLECIQNHQPRDTPQTIESTILRDADILEQLGAIGILRTVAKVGRDTRFATFTQAVASLQQALDVLPAQLKLDASRTLAIERMRIHREFLASVATEAGSNLL